MPVIDFTLLVALSVTPLYLNVAPLPLVTPINTFRAPSASVSLTMILHLLNLLTLSRSTILAIIAALPTTVL